MLLELVLSLVFSEEASQLTYVADATQSITERVLVARQVINQDKPARRRMVANNFSNRDIRFFWAPSQVKHVHVNSDSHLIDLIQGQILSHDPEISPSDIHIDLAPKLGRDHLLGQLKLSDGSWLIFQTLVPNPAMPWLTNRLTTALILMIGAGLVGSLIIQAFVTPLRSLSKAVAKVGDGKQHLFNETGPKELRHVAQAFNQMQMRIDHMLRERTEMLAAVSHDLRTPLARLQLRASFIEEDEIREPLEADLQEMAMMIKSVLQFLRGDQDPEVTRLTDIVAIIETLVNAAKDAGKNISYKGPSHYDVMTRPLLMKRAISNLIENALHYGETAIVSFHHDEKGVYIRVDDMGPGIPEDQIEHVLQPFRRLDTARQRNTAGLGLGLATVERTVKREGGNLFLTNRPEGGLRAEIFLPATQSKNAKNDGGKGYYFSARKGLELLRRPK
ncbi:signal transduction histidine kinase [Zymomonas mobilis]|uniref:histidine kinase n=2 Tax=Zymomonas mobilis TaxID=542 RepID=A0A542W1T1_ZYMMB|nr:signal transduction histidine kinase [Zymomonas mobilis]